MKDILNKIIDNKRVEIANAKISTPVESILDNLPSRYTISMYEALITSDSGIIAEFKRKSPSKGMIHPDAKIEDIIPLYKQGGASVISILTDNDFFGGSLDDLTDARKFVNIPILRKDFIIDPYQLVQACACGADAVLLIASALTPIECGRLSEYAAELGLEVLLEIHNESELRYVSNDIKIVGINNRNLGTFNTDVNNSLRIADRLPADKLLVSESGISNPDIVKQLRSVGYRGFLIGENFMKHKSPGISLAEFIKQLQ